MPVALVLLMLAVSTIYMVIPSVNQRFRLITPGAALAVIVWVIASLRSPTTSPISRTTGVIYGSLGAAIALLYFYISAAVLLLGAELNAAINSDSSRENATDKAQRNEPWPQ